MHDTFEVPQYLDPPESIWVKCEEMQELSDRETACLVKSEVNGRQRIVIVHPRHCDLKNNLIKGFKIAVFRSSPSNWLAQFPTGDQLLVTEGMLVNGHSL